VRKKYDVIKKLTTSHLKLKEFPTSMASVLDIEAHLEQLKLYEEFEPDVIIVDYGDIMRSTRKTNNLYEEQGWIFRELRGLAVKRNIVVITATQTNRDSFDSEGGTKEIIGMEKTADSMEKNRILDALFSITQKRQEKDQGKINLWVAKNRNGESSTILEFLINYHNMQIKEALLGSKESTENEDIELTVE
jgi:replicative DNA helicase